MAIVSVSEASRLAGKSRTTLQKYIKQGKLSKCTDANGIHGIDVSELIRVFGDIKFANSVQTINANNGQELPVDKNNNMDVLKIENLALKKEIELLKELLSEKDKRLLLLEHKKQQNLKKKKWLFF